MSTLGTFSRPGDGIYLCEFQEVMSNEDQIKGSGDILLVLKLIFHIKSLLEKLKKG